MEDKVLMLQKLVADLSVATSNVYHFHWNIEGPDFEPLHGWFGDIGDCYLVARDRVAERIRFYGNKVEGRLSQLAQMASVPERELIKEGQSQIEGIKSDMEILIKGFKDIEKVASEAGDIGLQNLLGDLAERVEKLHWKADSSLASPSLTPLESRPMIKKLVM